MTREVKDKREFATWWAMLLAGLAGWAWGTGLIVEYGINSPAAIIGVIFILGGTWITGGTFNLRRYMWYGDLD